MRITIELHLPADLGALRRFTDKVNRLVDDDMSAYVTYHNGWLSVCSELDDPHGAGNPWDYLDHCPDYVDGGAP